MTRRWRVAAGVLAVALSAYFVWFAIRSLDLTGLRETVSSGSMLAALLVAALMYATIIPITAWTWAWLLSTRLETWRPVLLAEILGLSQLAKYVPGNVAQHAARAAISMRHGMKPTSLLASVAQETVLAVAASLIVGVIALVVSGHGFMTLDPEYVRFMLAVGIALVAAIAVFSLGKSGRCWMPASGAVGRLVEALTTMPGRRATGVAILAYSINYLLIGLGLWLVAITLDPSHALSYFTVTAAFALSWILGFMTPGAPAGLGAREGIMLLVLHGSASAETLAAFVLLARLVTILGDVIAFSAALVLHLVEKNVRRQR